MRRRANRLSSRLSRNADFVRLWTGGAVSGLGSAMTALAYPLLALSVTDSAAAAGLVGLVTLAASAVMRLPAGVLIDLVPLRRVLVSADAVRAIAALAVAMSLLTGHLALWQLLAVAVVNACGAAFSDVAHSVALRHVVPGSQLPHAFALNEGRGHAVSLVGQPAGGVLYGLAPSLPLLADVVSFAISGVLSATIRHPLTDSSPDPEPRPQLRRDLLSGLIFLWKEPVLRATLLAAGGYQLVYAAAIFALIANSTAQGFSPASLGALFAIAAMGGIAGAVAAPALQARLGLRSIVVIMGWTAAATFGALIWVQQPLLAGALIGCIYFTSAPANAMLLAVQIERTPARLQGRVMAASFLIAGLVAPLGPPAAGVLLDTTGPVATFAAIAVTTAIVTVAIHLNRRMGESHSTSVGP